jgi:hypothetical protein
MEGIKVLFKELKKWFQYVNAWENLPEPPAEKRRIAGSPGFISWLFGPENLGEAEKGQGRSTEQSFLRWLSEPEHLDAPSMNKDNKKQ